MKWLFITSSFDPHFRGFFNGKRIRTNRSIRCAARIIRFVLIIPYGHTFATLAIQQGVDAKTVSNILGHYSAGFTLDTYTHVTGEMQKEAAQRMGSFMAQQTI